MPDGSGSFNALLDWLQILLVAGLGLLGFHYKTHAQKIDALAEKKANKADMDNALNGIRKTIENGFKQAHDDNNKLHERVDRMVDK